MLSKGFLKTAGVDPAHTRTVEQRTSTLRIAQTARLTEAQQAEVNVPQRATVNMMMSVKPTSTINYGGVISKHEMASGHNSSLSNNNFGQIVQRVQMKKQAPILPRQMNNISRAPQVCMNFVPQQSASTIEYINAIHQKSLTSDDFTVSNSNQTSEINPTYFDNEVVTVSPKPLKARKQRSSMLMMSLHGGYTQMAASKRRARQIKMDETVFQNALNGTLEEEGAENLFLSELGWATYLDQQGQSYAMNQRASVAVDGYYTPTIFSSPGDVLSSWVSSMQRVLSDPLDVAFPTITNDQTGLRSWGNKASEYKSRTIQTGREYPPSGDKLFNLFGMTPTETGGYMDLQANKKKNEKKGFKIPVFNAANGKFK